MIRNLAKHYLRTGRMFLKYLKESEERQKYTLNELRAYQNEKLKYIIKIAYENVPYYRHVLNERGLNPHDIRKVEDLHRIPLINKRIVQDNFNRFKNKNYKGLVFKGYTSGTTGAPGTFLRDLKSINFENATIWRQYRWANKDFKSKRVTLRGELILPSNKKNNFWKYDPFGKELLISSYHLSDDNMINYVEKIKHFNPFDLYAYPSTAYLLASFCKKNNISLKFSRVFTSSEVLLDYQKEEIEEVFNSRIFDWYGNAERNAAIGHCKYGQYHEMTDYSIMEYIPQGNNKYEIVGTTLNNTVMPLIRYSTGDIVELEDNDCSCGLRFRKIKNIIGRNDDIVVLKDGRRLGRLDHIFKGMNFIKEAQILQLELDFLKIRIVPSYSPSDEYKEILIKNLCKYIGSEGIRYSIDWVEKIDRGRNGKFKLVKNLVGKEQKE